MKEYRSTFLRAAGRINARCEATAVPRRHAGPRYFSTRRPLPFVRLTRDRYYDDAKQRAILVVSRFRDARRPRIHVQPPSRAVRARYASGLAARRIRKTNWGIRREMRSVSGFVVLFDAHRREGVDRNDCEIAIVRGRDHALSVGTSSSLRFNVEISVFSRERRFVTRAE